MRLPWSSSGSSTCAQLGPLASTLGSVKGVSFEPSTLIENNWCFVAPPSQFVWRSKTSLAPSGENDMSQPVVSSRGAFVEPTSAKYIFFRVGLGPPLVLGSLAQKATEYSAGDQARLPSKGIPTTSRLGGVVSHSSLPALVPSVDVMTTCKSGKMEEPR